MKSNKDKSWPRDWELALRSAEIAWSILGERPEIYERRCAAFSDRGVPPVKCSTLEKSRFTTKLNAVCEWLEMLWIQLYDSLDSRKITFVFSDAFSVLFFLRVLYANESLLFRGHFHEVWTISSTIDRANQSNPNLAKKSVAAGENFITKLLRTQTLEGLYTTGVPEEHKQAILQHYGFPTNLLDFTYSSDVAMFFAEGGSDYIDPETIPKYGAIYAIPPYLLPKTAKLLTLPPAVMRPSLQRGVFIANMSNADIERLETRHKYRFRHKGVPVWNGMSNIRFGSPTGLSRYLFPISDPIETLAKDFRIDP
jgi:FRG domain